MTIVLYSPSFFFWKKKILFNDHQSTAELFHFDLYSNNDEDEVPATTVDPLDNEDMGEKERQACKVDARLGENE